MTLFRSAFLPLLACLALVGGASTADAQQRVRGPATAKPAKAAARTAARAQVRQAPVGRQGTRAALKTTAAKDPTTVARKSLTDALHGSGAEFFVREVNGNKRIIANVSTQDGLDRVSAAMGKNANVIQILHIGRKDIQHSMAMFDGELIHAQYANGTGNWRLRNWGDKLRSSNTKMYSAFIALTPAEATALRANIAQGKKDQGPEETAGPGWANGKLKNTSMGGCRSFNCTSIWSQMPLGEGGETLSQIAGMGMGSGHPKMMQKELETSANARVIGVAVYGPRVEGFSADPAKPVTDL